ncbi:MAG: Uma2 family endonuclease [Synechococcales bacterium]|nr:Uma2 family endonuclease [Synechococcales bacterium]
MIAVRGCQDLTPDAYFVWEAQQSERYEYFGGAVLTMAGGNLSHGRIGLNLASRLNAHTHDRGCITFNSDCKVRIAESGSFTYPNVSVSCGDRDRSAQQFIQFPCVIIEILSPSTEAYDRGGKFRLYRKLPSLQEFVVVGSTVKSVEIFRRKEPECWEFMSYGEDESFTIASIGLAIAVNELYENVTLDPGEIY